MNYRVNNRKAGVNALKLLNKPYTTGKYGGKYWPNKQWTHTPINIHHNNNKTTSYNSTLSHFASSTIASRTSPLLHRLNPLNRTCHFQSVRFNLDQRASSPTRSVSVSAMSRNPAGPSTTKWTCSCSPTNHLISFRCRLHKNNANSSNSNSPKMKFYGSNKLERTAMKNSLVRIGVVEGDFVNRALSALIRKSFHQLRRLENFNRRSSRLSMMSKAED